MRIAALFLALAAVAARAQAPEAKAVDVKPKVTFTTSLGAFTVELEPKAAPKTVANFLAYVKKGHYKGTTFHRIIPGFMIQGGGMLPTGGEKPAPQKVENEARQASEAGLKNVRGALAMARTNEPHSASAQFFVNTVDNAFLDYPGRDGWGYCVFGKVVEGMDTVDKIKGVKTGPGDRPLQPVLITGASIVGGKAPAKAVKSKPKAKAAKK